MVPNPQQLSLDLEQSGGVASRETPGLQAVPTTGAAAATTAAAAAPPPAAVVSLPSVEREQPPLADPSQFADVNKAIKIKKRGGEPSAQFFSHSPPAARFVSSRKDESPRERATLPPPPPAPLVPLVVSVPAVPGGPLPQPEASSTGHAAAPPVVPGASEPATTVSAAAPLAVAPTGLVPDEPATPQADRALVAHTPTITPAPAQPKLLVPKKLKNNAQMDFFAARLASAVDEVSSDDSDETFVYELNANGDDTASVVDAVPPPPTSVGLMAQLPATVESAGSLAPASAATTVRLGQPGVSGAIPATPSTPLQLQPPHSVQSASQAGSPLAVVSQAPVDASTAAGALASGPDDTASMTELLTVVRHHAPDLDGSVRGTTPQSAHTSVKAHLMPLYTGGNLLGAPYHSDSSGFSEQRLQHSTRPASSRRVSSNQVNGVFPASIPEASVPAGTVPVASPITPQVAERTAPSHLRSSRLLPRKPVVQRGAGKLYALSTSVDGESDDGGQHEDEGAGADTHPHPPQLPSGQFGFMISSPHLQVDFYDGLMLEDLIDDAYPFVRRYRQTMLPPLHTQSVVQALGPMGSSITLPTTLAVGGGFLDGFVNPIALGELAGKEKKKRRLRRGLSKLRTTASKVFDRKGLQPRRYSTIPDDVDIDDYEDEMLYSSRLQHRLHAPQHTQGGRSTRDRLLLQRQSYRALLPSGRVSPQGPVRVVSQQLMRYGLTNDRFLLPRKRSGVGSGFGEAGGFFDEDVRISNLRLMLYTFFAFVLLLAIGFISGFLLATLKELQRVRIADITHVVLSEDEMVFNMAIEAFNPGFLLVAIDKVELDLFAKLLYVDGEPLVVSTAVPVPPPQTVLLGRIHELELTLTYDGGIFSRRVVRDVTEVKILHPGLGSNLTAVQATLPWLLVRKHPFELLISGTLRYKLPFSVSSLRLVVVNLQTHVDPEWA